MSSPFRRSDHSRSSPARSRINGLHLSRTNSQNHYDSNGYCEEMSRLHIDTEKAYQKLLDQRAQEQKRKHLEGLEKALEQHEQVQRSARACVERIQLEQQQARLRFEQEEKRKLEEERRKLEEAKRKAAEEEQKRQEAERKRQEQIQAEAKRKQEEEAARKAAEEKKKEEAEEARKKAERDKAAAEEEAKKKAAAQQAAQAQQNATQNTTQPAPSQPAPSLQNGSPAGSGSLLSAVTSSTDERHKVHDAYLAIHQRLKEVRKTVSAAMDGNPNFKDFVTSTTRTIRQSVGQINRRDKKANKTYVEQVMKQIDTTLTVNETTDMSQFMYNATPVQPIQGPLMLVYMLNCFSKCVLRQLESEAGAAIGDSSELSDPIGIAVALVFSNEKYFIDGRSLIDILWATFHRNVPRLFGGPVRQPQPKNRKSHGALASGFAAITLRQFPGAKRNPAPNRIFWEALARIVNTPVANMKTDQLTMLQWMLQPIYVSKFFQIYGAAAMTAVRHAIMVVAPAAMQVDKLKSEATALHNLRFTLEHELFLPL